MREGRLIPALTVTPDQLETRRDGRCRCGGGDASDTDRGLRSRGPGRGTRDLVVGPALLTLDCRANLSKPAPTADEPREPQ
jgi:hypothetical protein